MSFDGGSVTNLTNSITVNEGLPAFSPDGSLIAFVSDQGGNWAIWVMNADGSYPFKCFDLPGGALGQDWMTERISWGP